jgi:hypothetical protein
MFKYEGFEYSPEEVAEAAKEKDLTVDQYIDRYGLETVEVADEIQTVEVTDEIQTEPTEGKTNDVAVRCCGSGCGCDIGTGHSIREYGIRIGRYFWGVTTNR